MRLFSLPEHIIWESTEIGVSKMDEVDYLAECNAMWSGGEVGGYIGACCFLLYPDGGRKCLSNTDSSLSDYTASHTRRL
jgi:hypothetical protein